MLPSKNLKLTVTESVDSTLNLFFCNTSICDVAADWSIPAGCSDFADLYASDAHVFETRVLWD